MLWVWWCDPVHNQEIVQLNSTFEWVFSLWVSRTSFSLHRIIPGFYAAVKRELELVLCQLSSREAQMGFWPWGILVGISCGSPIYSQVFWPLRLPSANPTADKPWKWLPCTTPFLGHLELCRKNQEISYVGIHKDQRKQSKTSLWFTALQWFSPHNLLLLRVRHSRQNPVFADETWPRVSWQTLLFIHWGSSFHKLSCRNSAKCFL